MARNKQKNTGNVAINRLVQQLANLTTTTTKTRKKTTRPRRRMGVSRDAGSAPAAMSTIQRNNTPRTVRMSGVDWIDSEEVSSTTTVGEVIARISGNPRLWPSSHAGLMASGFEKYRVQHLHFRVSSRAPTNISGGVVAGFNPDPENEIVGSNSRQAVRALPGSASAALWQPFDVTYKPPRNAPVYFSDPSSNEERFTSPGEFLMVLDAKMNATGSVSLVIEVNWSFIFESPTIPTRRAVKVKLPAPSGKDSFVVDETGHGLAIKVDAEWGTWYSSADAADVWSMNPGITGKNRAGAEVKGRYLRKIGQPEYFLFQVYQTFEDAYSAGDVPARDYPALLLGKSGDEKVSVIGAQELIRETGN